MKTILTIIQPDGTTTTETAKERPSDVPLERLQQLVGGYIELLPKYGSSPTAEAWAPAFKTVYVNEEGKLLGMEPNFPAMEAIGWPTSMADHWLMGPVVILEKAPSNGA